MRGVWTLLAAELFGTAFLVAFGVSLVILDFGNGSPVVTLAFWLNSTMRGGLAAAYAVAQLAGGVAGACALLAWGPVGASVRFGATVPGVGFGPWAALVGEIATTMALVLGLFVFLGHGRLRPFTPLLFPVLYAVMVWLEAPISGTGTNPARTLGPAVVAGVWRGWWVYLAGPVCGAVLGFGAHRLTWLRTFEVEVSKLYHFGHDPLGVLCRRSGARALHGG